MKHLLITELCAIFLSFHAIVAAGLESGGSWIWHADTQQGVNMPAGQRFFRKHVILPADRVMKKAVMELSADNEFVLYINGKKVGSGKNWMELSSFDVRKHLSAGDNVVAVEAGNWNVGEANPAGLIGSLRIDFDKGKPVVLVTDVSWKTSSKESAQWEAPGFDDKTWAAARRLGPYGCMPWKAFAGGGSAAPARAGSPSPSIYDEPETRTLSSEEGEQLLRDEWIFQAEGKPLDERALQEISWAREIAVRLKKSTRPPDLSPELTMLEA
ncbi:MAG: hypothetical protein QGI24_10785, partial [Kiritimatiellia bacterium]|nr:hypothetical protein [Kiritimatiellia bacterium]